MSESIAAARSTPATKRAIAILSGGRRRYESRGVGIRSRRAHAAIVGGAAISIEAAPWQVAVFAELKEGTVICGGSILNSTHILTAGHCVFNPEAEEERTPAGDFVVVAGTSNITPSAIETSPTAQARDVAAVRVHPYFHYAEGPGTSDDIAVLGLAEP